MDGRVLAGESNRPRTQSSYQEKMHKVCTLRRSITKQRDAENPLKREKILGQDSCRYILRYKSVTARVNLGNSRHRGVFLPECCHELDGA